MRGLINQTNHFHSVLEGLGFKGVVLMDMTVLITTKEELGVLEAFIINNSHLRTSLSIAKAFRKQCLVCDPVDILYFHTHYISAKSLPAKKKCLEKTLKCYVDTHWIMDLDSKIHSGETTLVHFFECFQQFPNLHIRKLITEACIAKAS